MFSLAQRAAKQRNAAGRQSDKTGGGAENRATRLPGESHGGGAGSGCELTPSHVLAEVYHHDALDGDRARGIMLQVACRRESCCSIQPSSYHEPSTAAPSPAYRLSAGRGRGRGHLLSQHPLETSITTCLARRPRAPPRISGTSRRLFRNRESEISTRLDGPGDSLPSLSLSLPLSLLPPFRAPSLPPT